MEPTKETISEAQGQLNDILGQVRDANNGITALRQEIEGREAEKKLAEDALLEKQGEVLAENDRLSAIEKRISDSSAKLDGIEAQINDATESLSLVLGQVEEAKSAFTDNVQATFDAQNKLVVDAKNQLLSILAETDALVAKQKDLQDSIEVGNAYYIQLQDNIKSATEQKTSLNMDILDITATINELKKENEDAKVSLDIVNGNIVNARNTLKSVLGDVENAKTEIESLSGQIDSLKAELLKNDTKNKDFILARAGLQASVQEFNQRMETLRGMYGDLNLPW